MGFPWEWEYDQPWDENGMGMGIIRVAMGIKTWKWGKSRHEKFHMLQFYSNIAWLSLVTG